MRRPWGGAIQLPQRAQRRAILCPRQAELLLLCGLVEKQQQQQRG